MKNNINLAIKATVGIACYAELEKVIGERDRYTKYRKIAENYADKIYSLKKRFSHLPLTWESGEDTFSLKYNLTFGKILKLDLFPKDLLESEIDFYLTKLNKYGIPLDNRKEYSKSDWLVWTASLTDDSDKRDKIVNRLCDFLRQSPDRVPFSDWYETDSGKHNAFTARTVQGGCFVLLLNRKTVRGNQI